MHIRYSSIAEMIRDTTGKPLIAQIPKKIKPESLKNLKPVTDIDDEIIVYSIGKDNSFLVDSTRLDDLLEPMSFERKKAPYDSFRTDELYVKGEEPEYVHSPYDSKNDVPLREDLLMPYRPVDYVAYSPLETNYSLSDDVNDRLSRIYLRSDIIPSTLGSHISLEGDTIESILPHALNALHSGTPISNIIRSLEKSVLDTSGRNKFSPELFGLLSKYPEARRYAVVKDSHGNEVLNSVFPVWYPMLRQRFSNIVELQKVIKDCSTINSFDTPTLEPKLCEIVTLMKPTHISTPTYGRFGGNRDRVIHSWTNEDSALIAKLHDGDTLNYPYYLVTKSLLKDGKSVDYILENLDSVVKSKADVFSQITKLPDFSTDKKACNDLLNDLSDEFFSVFDEKAVGYNKNKDYMIQAAKLALDYPSTSFADVKAMVDYVKHSMDHYLYKPNLRVEVFLEKVPELLRAKSDISVCVDKMVDTSPNSKAARDHISNILATEIIQMYNRGRFNPNDSILFRFASQFADNPNMPPEKFKDTLNAILYLKANYGSNIDKLKCIADTCTVNMPESYSYINRYYINLLNDISPSVKSGKFKIATKFIIDLKEHEVFEPDVLSSLSTLVRLTDKRRRMSLVSTWTNNLPVLSQRCKQLDEFNKILFSSKYTDTCKYNIKDALEKELQYELSKPTISPESNIINVLTPMIKANSPVKKMKAEIENCLYIASQKK